MDYYFKQQGGQVDVWRAESPPAGAVRVPDGALPVIEAALAQGLQFRVVGSSVQVSPPAPGPFLVWDWERQTWSDPRPLNELKAACNTYINAERLRANQAFFTYGGEQIAVDLRSRGDIETTNGAVLLTGTMPPDWPGGWKTVANRYVPIPDVSTWTRFYLAMTAQGSVNFARSQQLKAQLANATTAEAVAAIAWSTP